MSRLLPSRAASRIPGDTTRVMTAPATDRSGRVWPRGTKFRPLSGGNRQVGYGRARSYATVTIGMDRVSFDEPDGAAE